MCGNSRRGRWRGSLHLRENRVGDKTLIYIQMGCGKLLLLSAPNVDKGNGMKVKRWNSTILAYFAIFWRSNGALRAALAFNSKPGANGCVTVTSTATGSVPVHRSRNMSAGRSRPWLLTSFSTRNPAVRRNRVMQCTTTECRVENSTRPQHTR